MDREDRPRRDILAFTLPGFATGEHTKRNAVELCRALGVTFAEIDITETAKLMLKEMDHPFSRGEKVYDVTFENVQAGLRTDYLFRLANQRGGIVLGPVIFRSWDWAGRLTVSAIRCRITTSTPVCPRH